MANSRTISSLSDIANQVDAFFVDMFGVLWDGQAFYPEALQACQQLMQQGKKIYILTNTTMLAEGFREKYSSKGLILGKHYTDVITSGDAFQYELEHHAFLDEITHSDSSKYLLVGMPNDKLLRSVLARQTMDLNQASAVYMGALLKLQGNEYVHLETIDSFIPLLKQAIQAKLPAICVNPDHFAIINKKKCVVQGSLGHWYEEQGGRVYWFGKPYQDLYAYALNKTQMHANYCVMVGDTIRTDILGGKNAGMQTVLITGYGVTHDRIHNGETLEQIIEQEKATPDFLLSVFR